MSGYEQCPNWPWAHKILLTPRHYYTRGKNAVYRAAKEVGRQLGRQVYYAQTSDDSEWLYPDWGKMAVNALESSFPNGLGVIELFQLGHCAHYVTKFEFVDGFLSGNLGDPVFTMYFSDTDMLIKCSNVDRYRAATPTGSMAEQSRNRIVTHAMNATGDHTAFEVQQAWWDVDADTFYKRYPERDDRPKPEDDRSQLDSAGPDNEEP